ncbi:hypothetical protein HK105_201357 [Polyrhizophydium stewartii]|uniref:Ankyrin repeat protein n=1 Tax=Polyrhizophydium stewartii TaxID=2732419 RepID=A0ABR4NHS2_9FUNG
MAVASRFAGCADVADMLERLPFELGEAVYEHAGLTTKLLHSRLPLPLDDRTSALVWIDCMANDLVGCVPKLPQRSLTFEPYLAPPSDAMKSAILKRHDLASTHFGLGFSRRLILDIVLFSMDACKKTSSLELLLPYIKSAERLVPAAIEANATRSFKMLAERVGVSRVAKCHINHAFKKLQDSLILWMIKNHHCIAQTQFDHIVVACIEYRRIDLLKTAVNFGIRLSAYGEHAGKAAACGDMELFAFIKSHLNSDDWFKEAMRIAAGKGDLEAVRRLHSDFDLACDHGAMDAAAAGGHMDVIEFLHTHRTEGFTGAAMIGAAQAGHLGVVRFLHEQRIECNDTKAMDGAACNGHVDVLEFFRTERGARCSAKAIAHAAHNGHARSVNWLLEHFPDESILGVRDAIYNATRQRHRKLASQLIHSYTHLTDTAIAIALTDRCWMDLFKIVARTCQIIPRSN